MFEHYASVRAASCSKTCAAQSRSPESFKTRVKDDQECRACGESYTPASNRQVYCKGCAPNRTARARMYRYHGAVPKAPTRELKAYLPGAGEAPSHRHRRTRYRISEKRWRAMLARYDGMCWVCKQRPAIHVEHDHSTGRVRGAACYSCNLGLSFLDRPDWVAQAMAYLAEEVDIDAL
jgi:hypothetical protein